MTWSGVTRAGLHEQTVYPPTAAGALPTWIAVGGTPESVVRAAQYGLPLMLAIIGGEPLRFAPYVDLYHRALKQFGQATTPVGVHAHGYVAAHRPPGASTRAGRTTPRCTPRSAASAAGRR